MVTACYVCSALTYQKTFTNGVTPQYTLHCKVREWMKSKRIGIIVIGLLALATSAVIVLKRFRSATAPPPPAAVRETHAVGSLFTHEIVGEYPHDADAFTQGLIYLDVFLYESTGITGRSSLRT